MAIIDEETKKEMIEELVIGLEIMSDNRVVEATTNLMRKIYVSLVAAGIPSGVAASMSAGNIWGK